VALFTWNESYSVKVQSCDMQHKQLFEIINRLADAMRMGKGDVVVTTTIGELLRYTRTHFSEEEKLLQRANYPALAAHQALHRHFVSEIESLDEGIRQGRRANSVQVLNMLRDWLIDHIQKTDKAYSAHLNAAGIQ
jgi:hemerythrin-like metal-binding protein